jgi:catechol O-methyltransferase
MKELTTNWQVGDGREQRVADTVLREANIKFPGAPAYQEYMNEQEGKLWATIAHKSFIEYQSLIPDIVLESVYCG